MSLGPHVSLEIVGVIDDAFLYRTSLYIVSGDRLLRCRTSNLRRQLQLRFVEESAYVTALLPDTVPHRRAWPFEADNSRSVELRLTLDELDCEEIHTGGAIPMGALLDLTIFHDRLFLGTTDGLLAGDLDQDESSTTLDHLGQRSATRCEAISVGLSSMAASYGEDGFTVYADELDLRGLGRQDFVFEQQSHRTLWLRYRLLNLGDGLPDPFVTATAAVTQSDPEDDSESGEPPRTVYVLKDLRAQADSVQYDDHLKVVDGFHSSLFGQAGDSLSWMEAGGAKATDRTSNYRERARLRLPQGAIVLAVSQLGDGNVVVDTTFGVAVSDGVDLQWMTDEVAVAVRSFPRSKRYVNVALATFADRLLLFSGKPGAQPGSGPTH
jgi:hypothetical protein